jgi:hypothetical protein
VRLTEVGGAGSVPGMRCAVAGLLLVAACQFSTAALEGNPGTPDASPVVVDGSMPDGPEVVVDGGAPDGMCAPRCEDDTLIGCEVDAVDCPLGCVPAGATPAHCGVFVPQNGFSLDAAKGTADQEYAADAFAFDTDTGEIWQCSIMALLRDDTVDDIDAGIFYTRTSTAGIFGVRSFSVAGTGSVRLVGSRAFVLIAGGDVSIDGNLRLSAGARSASVAEACAPSASVAVADRVHAGVGGGTGGAPQTSATGSSAGATGDMNGEGGGGGGNGTAGGAGGHSGGAGGAVAAGGISLLRGGGGGGGGRAACGGYGGGGGGVLQISSPTEIRVRGAQGIQANGSGGSRGEAGCGGGGGGAGGTIILDAPTVEITAFVSARGGGGGAGDCANDENVDESCQGQGPGGSAAGFGVAIFTGGVRVTQGGVDTRGGNGNGQAGTPAGNTGTSGGGGGGAVGRIFLRALSLAVTDQRVSPTPDAGSILVQ